uniref:Cytoplasmic dynein 2 heavy chain 1 n=1 Tax=Caenorhabditis tropicalis TaxID=1561998 RepID=A0A1I7UMZ6_9PELO
MLSEKNQNFNEDSLKVDAKNFQFLTEVAARIVWIRQETSQMESIRSLSKTMLNDISNYAQFAQKLDDFIEKLQYAEKECFDDWCRETVGLIDNKNETINLETTGKIMYLEASNRELNVNYSDRLLRLLKVVVFVVFVVFVVYDIVQEVRQLSSLGFNIPSKILSCANNGEKYYRFGVILKQIAHFYNTIDQQMIPSQQSLMLEEAIAFEKLVIPRKDASNSASKVTWNDPKQLEEFIGQLQTAEQKLSNRNRRLRNVHMELIELVEKLMDLNIVKQNNDWKEIILKIRSKMKEEEVVHGAAKNNMKPWLIHWDFQLYKALLIQYEWGIESIQSQLSTISVSLVFVDQKIQLRPAIEEVRSKYYKELCRFLRIPDKFRGVQEDENSTEFYAQMIERSMHLLPSVYEKAEQLMNKVETCDAIFADWLVISQVDLEELIEENLKTAADWEAQFKVLKAKAREAERLPHELKFECILVSTAGVKSAIEDAIQRLYDALTWTLRHSISTTSQSISTFLNQAIDVLNVLPKTLDEVAEANAKHVIFVETNRRLKGEWKIMEEQLTLLRSVAGQGMEQIDNLEQTWDKFELMLDSHQAVIKEQVEALKSNVETSIKGMKDEAEKLKARWDQFKPRSEALQGDREEMLKAIQFIKEKRTQWQELSDGREKIEKECGQFGLEPPKLDLIDQIDEDIKQFEDNWLIYEMFNTDLDTLSQEEWIVFRGKTYLFDEFLQKWQEKLKTGSQTHMSVRLMKDVEHFKEVSSALKFCRGDVLSADHWHEMFRFLGLPRGTTIEKLKFADLLSVSKNIIENVDQLKQLNSRAQGEVAIRDAIQELTLWAAQTEFTLADYKHSNGQNLKIIKEWKESINSLKDSQALLQSLKSSPYYSQFTDKTAVWETRLADLDVFLAQMNEIQRKWIYLEPIFGRGALPSEASRFSRVDSEYRAILNDVAKDARLVSLCGRQSLKKTLEQIVDQLNRCQKALNQFLEQKRTAFPRFYFIGDDDLLEILGQSTNPQVIQTHMKKLFQGINRVVFSSTGETITSMVSAEGETVPLSKAVRIVPQVETWLQQLSDEMRRTLKDLTAQAVSDGQISLAKYPSQVLCLAEEVKFSASVENALSSSSDLSTLKSQLLEKLKTYTNMKVDDKVADLKLKSLILDLIHHIDVIDQLISNKASATSCWTWQRQLRFYLVNGGIVLRQVSSEFEYTYEYQGNYAKLVHTPLTDKCYLTLTQAMYMGLGGNPYGPAGTGKTESVKALAALMGRQVLVFNCDEGIDLTSMGRIFTGIVECGAWGCFDEFNRLDSTVLSAVSMQIQTIQGAIKSRAGACTFGGKNVQVNPNSAIFVTLNPAGKGYGGRQKMPDNLKQLFRAVVMGKPDNELISSTILYSEGFVDATSLARKIVSVFQLSRQMLSKQQHYDWGLRALKVVLGGCGALRRNQPTKAETDLVVQALLLNTLSKLTFSDSERFNSLIDDIFSNVNKEMTKFEELVEPLGQAAGEMGIKLGEKQMEKVFQLYEQLRQRIGVVVVGAAGSGKSTIWKVLQRALVLTKKPLKVTKFNPKAVNRMKLLGNMDMDTREWSDGIITMAAREVQKDTTVHHWIVCDGDIDPEWVEALNSVLDDNRLLTMPSGERIQFGSNVNFLFETDSLQFASPATVSRMGMIYISEEDVTPQEIVSSWLHQNSEDLHADVATWIEDNFWKTLKWVKGHQIPGISNFALLKNGLTHLKGAKTKTQFLVLLFNGFQPYVPPDQRSELAKLVFQGITVADSKNICYDERIDGIMTYTDDVTQSVTKEEMEREDLRPFVQTADIQRYSDIISSWLRPNNRESFLITGTTGCGKQQLLKHCFQLDPDSQLASLYCSAQTSSAHLLQLIQQNCVQASNPNGRVWRPKDRPNMILFLKGINLPAPDKYGTNELLALLQQLLTYQGFFDYNLEWVSIENIQFVGSMDPIDGSSSLNISNRLFSLLRCISLNSTDTPQLTSIYRTYLTPILEEFGNPESIAGRMVDVYNRIQSNFKSSESIVFQFSPRDLTNWTVSLLRHELDQGRLDAAICFEARRIFQDRLPTEADKQKFDEILRNVIPISQSAAFEVANFNSPLTTQLASFCAHIDRVLTTPGGHLFLPGRTGYGRRDAVRLIANMHNISVFSPPVTANFSAKQFDNELKTAITQAVTNNEHVVLILEDHQLRRNVFLQAINSLLASGNIPGLFTQQELDGLVAMVSEAANQAAFTGALQQFLAHRIKSLLHVVLILEVEAPDFKLNITENPAILKHCNVIYADRFDRNALQEIPKLLLESKGVVTTDAILSGFADVIVNLPEHLSIQPIKYRQFVENCAQLLGYKRSTLSVRLDRLKGGVSKLNEAREEVAKMQKKAGKKSKLLAEKQAEADEALKAITESMSGAEDQKMSMEQLKAATEKENVVIEEKKAKIDEQLKEVQPLIDEARRAVGSIKSESLSEIRSLRAPPEAVRDILQAVLVFMGILDTSWEAMRKKKLIQNYQNPVFSTRFLSKSGVKDDIMNFDANRITNEIHKKVTALVKQKSASFEEANAKRASAAAAPLAAWVKANLEYSKILEKISPLEAEKNKLVKNLKKAEKQMENLSKGLQSVDEVVGELKRKFEVLMKEATQIKVDLDREQDTIRIAGTLVESLSGEFQRWKVQIETLGEEQSKMELCSLITSAFITYLGGCSEKDRKSLLKAMCKMFNMQHFNPLSFASLETEQLNWKTKGLPADQLSLENGMIMFNSSHVPLIIDPSGQVSLFLSKFLEKSETFKAAQPDLMTQIELAIRFGKTIIVDDVVEFDSCLIPILRKDLSSQGPRQVISFAGKSIDFNPDFRIFICTRDEKIGIRPNCAVQINTVNFTTTISALSAQLLDVAIHLEKPELEERSSSLLRDAELKKLELEGLEQLLLQQLASSQGNLLENTALLDSLNKSKESAEIISKSIVESEQLHKELTTQKDIYVPLSTFTSSLFFSFSNLLHYNPMYSYSVNTIMRLFEKTIKSCEDKSSNRVATLGRSMMLTVFYHISRGIFRQDRLMFAVAFINATHAKLFQPKEWELFTGALVDESTDLSGIRVSWISPDRLQAMARIRTHLPSLFNSFQIQDDATWNEFSKTLQCETAFPKNVEVKLTHFQKVLFIQAAKPDRLYNCLMDFVLKVLEIPSINPPAFELKHIFAESESTEPILFILADGADPSQELADLATNLKVPYHSISMGQGQEQVAYEAIREAAAKGKWLCLNNLHLMLQAVPSIFKELSLTTPHENFRLWLTTEADPRFPSMMLQQSLKITFEPPPGVRNNLLRTYTQIDRTANSRNVVTFQSIFVLAWLHALLQERRTFIPQGWTKFYEFGASDVRVAKSFVEQLTENKADWEFVRGILKFVIYGGRIENDFDAKVLDSYLNVLFSDAKINGRAGQELVKGIEIPATVNVQEYIAHIAKSVPAVDEPFLFGLPENIKYSWQIVEADRTISSIRTLALGDSKNALSDQSEKISQIVSLWKKLCQSDDLPKRELPQSNRSSDPIPEVLCLETINALNLIKSLHKSIGNMAKSLKNPSLADSKTQKTIQSLLFQQTPDEWDSLWAGPTDPADYLNAVVKKTRGTMQLYESSKSSSLLSSPIDFSDLFYPNIFLNALRQMTSRQLKTPLDQLVLSSAWTPSQLPNKQCVQVQGLLLQGATFDSFLRETTVSSAAYSQAPILFLAWTAENSSTISGEQIQVPLYSSSDRSDLITAVNMPCRGADQWNIAAVALFLR